MYCLPSSLSATEVFPQTISGCLRLLYQYNLISNELYSMSDTWHCSVWLGFDNRHTRDNVGQSSLYLNRLNSVVYKTTIRIKEIDKRREFVWLQKSNSK